VKAVTTHLGEGRACLPMVDGTTLVGTGGGLALVAANGDVRRVWTASDGLPGTRIDALALTGDEIWVGTDAGAARITAVVQPEGAPADLMLARTVAGTSVRDVAKLGGTVYLATWGGGVRAVTASSADALPVRGRGVGAKLQASSLAIAAGVLYAGTASGLYRLAGAALEPVALTLPATAAIASLHGDGDKLWIATSDGLYLREGTRERLVGAGDFRRVSRVNGDIVAASVGDGLVRVDRGRLVPLAGRPAAPMMQALASRDGAVCAGALDGTYLQAGPGASWQRVAHRAGPPSNDISAMAVDGDRLWVGTFDRGLAVREKGAWRAIAHPELDRRINALHVERRPGGKSRVWIATASGLHSFEDGVATRMSKADGLPSRSVLAVAGLRDGRVVAGTSRGAVVLGASRPQRLGPKAVDVGNVWAIAEDADGRVWLGTTTGLHRGKPDDDASWQRFSIATGHLRDDWITALTVKDRAVYAGTYHGGVVRIDIATDATVTAAQLGDGWINPGGLRFDGDRLDGDRLLAATMDGLFSGDGTSSTWTRIGGLPGVDVTASVRLGTSLIVTTRRGLAELR
jgi:ligand-binding sensor domain-containing protein